MRELKFRAWNGVKMVNPDSVVIYLSCGWIEDFNFDCKAIHIDKKAQEVMQYTGFKDKNGVEIYEGDIIQSVNHKTRELYCRTVKFVRGQFIYTPNRGILHDHIPQGVIVGNIYENPELLKR